MSLSSLIKLRAFSILKQNKDVFQPERVVYWPLGDDMNLRLSDNALNGEMTRNILPTAS